MIRPQLALIILLIGGCAQAQPPATTSAASAPDTVWLGPPGSEATMQAGEGAPPPRIVPLRAPAGGVGGGEAVLRPSQGGLVEFAVRLQDLPASRDVRIVGIAGSCESGPARPLLELRTDRSGAATGSVLVGGLRTAAAAGPVAVRVAAGQDTLLCGEVSPVPPYPESEDATGERFPGRIDHRG